LRAPFGCACRREVLVVELDVQVDGWWF